MNFERLKEPFSEKDIEWRIQSAGKNGDRLWARVLAYVTNRAIMNRLDEVCGPENWRNEFKEWSGKGVLCGISIKINDEWITKWDGAEETDIEKTKGGLSGAMKRAAVQWGIGRYLYNLESGFATISKDGEYFQTGKTGSYDSFRWSPPSLPDWALPVGEASSRTVADSLNIDDRILACKSITELMALWGDLKKDDQEFYKELFSKQRTELGHGGKE